jgi:hypothetical protein
MDLRLGWSATLAPWRFVQLGPSDLMERVELGLAGLNRERGSL